METKEFKKLIDRYSESSRNNRVVLVTDNTSVGGRCRLPIKHVNSGFDWERGDILIEVEDKIYSKEVSDMQLLNKFIYNIDTSAYQKIRSSVGDAECRKYLLIELEKFKSEKRS